MVKLDLTYITHLVLDAMNGSSEAFAELYAATYQEQYRFAYQYLGDEYLAQDALQQTYLQALQGLRSLTEPDLFLAQLRHTGYKICFLMKQRQEHGSKNLEQMTFSICGEEYTVSRILTLPFTESQILLMKYGDRMTTGEIAQMMRLSRRAVRRYQARGQKRLQKIMNVST